MDPTKLPTTILNKHPELKHIGEALAAYREGRPVTTTCPTCEGPLRVEEIKAVGSIWVLCPNGCTRAHFISARKATRKETRQYEGKQP